MNAVNPLNVVPPSNALPIIDRKRPKRTPSRRPMNMEPLCPRIRMNPDGTIEFMGIFIDLNVHQQSFIMMQKMDAIPFNQRIRRWNEENPQQICQFVANENNGGIIVPILPVAIKEKGDLTDIKIQNHWIPAGTVLVFCLDLNKGFVTKMSPWSVEGQVVVKGRKSKKSVFVRTPWTVEMITVQWVPSFEIRKFKESDLSGLRALNYRIGSKKNYLEPNQLDHEDRVRCNVIVETQRKAKTSTCFHQCKAFNIRRISKSKQVQRTKKEQLRAEQVKLAETERKEDSSNESLGSGTDDTHNGIEVIDSKKVSWSDEVQSGSIVKHICE